MTPEASIDLARPQHHTATAVPGGAAWWSRPEALAAIVAVLAVAAYANSIANGFAYDDVWIIRENPRVHRLSDLRAVWLTPYWPTFGPELGLYRPLIIFLYALQWAASGGDPWLFHAVNVLLHAGVSLLGFLLLVRLVPPVPAFLGAAVFALHPVHTEAVANVVGQAELVAAAASLGAVLVFTARPERDRVSPIRLAAIGVLYLAAMLAKESAIVLPALLLGFDAAARRIGVRDLRGYAWSLVLPFAVLGVLAAACLALRMQVIGSIAGSDPAPSLPFLREPGRIFVAFRTWPEYVRLLFFPLDLSSDYSPAVILPPDGLTPGAAAGAGLLVATVLLAMALPWRPGAALPAFWFLVGILPVSNLLFPVGIVLAERTLYTPSLAVAFVAGHAAHSAMSARRERLALSLASILLLGLGVRTFVRNPTWKDTATVHATLLREHPESYRAQWSGAVRALERGDSALSEQHWTLAYRIWPHDSQLLTEIGAYLIKAGRPGHAVHFLEAAHRLHPRVPRTEHLLAIAYIGARRYPEALTASERALRNVGPRSFLVDARARALLALGRPTAAAHAWRDAIRLAGGRDPDHWTMLANALRSAGDLAGAHAALDSARVRAELSHQVIDVTDDER